MTAFDSFDGAQSFLKSADQYDAQAASGEDGEQTFFVRQPNSDFEIEPLHHEDFDGVSTVEDFYSYSDPDGASANTPNDMEESGLSQLFFFEGTEGISLVFIHDEPNNGDGGSVDFGFETLPDGGEWVVKDDSGDGNYSRDGAVWGWAPCCTDGGAYRARFDRAFSLSILPREFDGIDEWEVVDGSGDGLTRHSLDMESGVWLGSLGGQTLPDKAKYALDITGDLCMVSETDAKFCVRGGPNVKLGPRDCPDISAGKTPPLISVDIQYQEFSYDIQTAEQGEVQFTRNIWIGVELYGEPCIWVGEEELGVCAKLGGCNRLPTMITDAGEPQPDQARTTANVVIPTLSEESNGEVGLPSPDSLAYDALVWAATMVIMALVFWQFGPSVPVVYGSVVGA